CGVYNNSDCNDAQLQYFDGDGDGFGSDTLVACGVTNNSDCDDTNGSIQNGDTVYYADADGDGYGNPDVTTTGCSLPPAGYVTNNTDCNDAAFGVNPGAAEILYNGIDDNCDG